MRALLVVALAVSSSGLGGCVESRSVQCADGSTCPSGYQCNVAASTGDTRCLVPEQLQSCAGQLEGADCTFGDSPGACRDGACEPFFCGDSFVTGTEECDGANLGVDHTGQPATCISIGWYAPDGLRCNDGCRWDRDNAISTCGGGRCGDVEVNGPELCDGPTSKTCISIGFDAGTVSCGSDCGFQIRDCSRFGWNPESISDVVALAVAGSGADDQWAVGLNGRAMHYEGAFWSSVPTGVTNDLVAAWSNGATDAYAVGQGGGSASVLIHWDGTLWSPVAGLPTAELVDVWAADSNAVFIATTTGVLRKSGATWVPLSSDGVIGEPIKLRGSTATNLWLATRELVDPETFDYDYRLYRGDGTTWTLVTFPLPTGVHFIDANAPNDVWVAGEGSNPGIGVIAHFDGATWTRWETAGEIYNNIASSAPNDAWVAGVDGVMRHYDGVAWSKSTNVGASPSGLAAISGLISLGASEVLGVSTLNLAYRYRGQSFGLYPPIGPNPFDAIENTAMWGSATDDQYITNVRGEVFHYDGRRWLNVFTVPVDANENPVPAHAIWGDAANNVWVGANDSSVYHWDGTTWTTEVVATTPIRKLWGSGGADLWAFTSTSAFHRTAPGVWELHTLGGANPLSVSGSGPDDIYLVDVTDRLWHWSMSTWTEVAMDPSLHEFRYLSVVAVGPEDVHVSLARGRLLHLGATGWTLQVVTPLDDLTFLAADAHDDVIAASQRDLYHFNGEEWAALRPPVDFVPNTADYIPIIGVQVFPGRVDMLLQRYRVRTLLRTRPLTCRDREGGACGDGVDNDCDGALDSRDTECI